MQYLLLSTTISCKLCTTKSDNISNIKPNKKINLDFCIILGGFIKISCHLAESYSTRSVWEHFNEFFFNSTQNSE